MISLYDKVEVSKTRVSSYGQRCYPWGSCGRHECANNEGDTYDFVGISEWVVSLWGGGEKKASEMKEAMTSK
jgi:hypothetical protein